MSLILSALLLAATAQPATSAPRQAPTPAAQALGRRLAESGVLASMLPMLARKETEELVAAHGELAEADRATLRRIGAETGRSTMERLAGEMGRSYAAQLSEAELGRLVAMQEDPLWRRYRALTPAVMAQTMKAVGSIDFKRETMAAFCKQTGKGCTPR